MKGINILMLGGKRCGKTTVLSSMCSVINTVLAGTDMRIDIMDEMTRAGLAEACTNIQKKIECFKTPLTRIELDDNPTDAQKTYSFRLYPGKGGKPIPFKMHDIPGEWLTDAHQENVRELVRECQVILIAIDTPYLFSKLTDKGYGIYHEEYNKPEEITNFFKNSLSVEEISNRMILFVPIKCERYYHLTHTPQLNVWKRDYMHELVEAVNAGYYDLIWYLRSTQELYQSCTLAVTPILSAGGIDFMGFKEDPETHRMLSLYQEPEFLPEAERGYQPKFCEQPMVYALTHIISETLESKNRARGRFLFHADWFGGKSRQQLTDALENLRKKMKRNSGFYDEDGYYIIQNPKEL